MMSKLGGPAIIEQEPRLGDSHLHLAAALPAQVQVSPCSRSASLRGPWSARLGMTTVEVSDRQPLPTDVLPRNSPGHPNRNSQQIKNPPSSRTEGSAVPPRFTPHRGALCGPAIIPVRGSRGPRCNGRPRAVLLVPAGRFFGVRPGDVRRVALWGLSAAGRSFSDQRSRPTFPGRGYYAIVLEF